MLYGKVINLLRIPAIKIHHQTVNHTALDVSLLQLGFKLASLCRVMQSFLKQIYPQLLMLQ